MNALQDPGFNKIRKNFLCKSVISSLMLDARKIAKLRERMELTQVKMAELFGVADPLTVSRWELGKATPKGPAMRFLAYLDTLSDAELKLVLRRLQQITKHENSK
jgi:DNA-binding transcriptional regulator YiaG